MTDTLRCIIVDDEPLARTGLEKYVGQVGFLAWTGSFENALLATDHLALGETDLIFLDIHMPYLTGIDLLKTLRNPPLVIFHTAYPNFALEGYQLDVLDYLVKPVSFDRFFKAATKAREYFELRNRPAERAGASPPVEFIFVKCDKRYEKVLYADILYVEAVQNYSVIQTPTQRLMTLKSLKSFEELLSAGRFERVHKSYIVALDKITAFVGNEIQVGTRMIPLSEQHRASLFDRVVLRTK
jgi:two-component system, LytTR family, response regulator